MKKPEQLKEPIPLGYGLADARIDECFNYLNAQLKNGKTVSMTIIDPSYDPYNYTHIFGDWISVIPTSYFECLKVHFVIIVGEKGGSSIQLFPNDVFRFYNFD